MKTFRSALFLSALALTAPVFADAHADAEKLMTLTVNTGSAAAGARAALAPLFAQARQHGIPEEGLKEMGVAADTFFNKTFNDPDLRTDMVKLLEDTYTPEELAAIIAFYETPAGKKSLEMTPIIAQKGMTIGQKYAAKNQEEFQSQLREIFQRYQKPADGAAPAAPAPETPAKPDKK